MATYQLGSLPNLQIANSNAPQASDANTALAFIRQNNEDQRQGANNLGLQALQAVKDITQTHQQFQQQQKQAAFQKKMGEAFDAEDVDAMRKLAVDYPEQMQAIQQGMGFVDANKNQAIGSAAMALKLAAAQGPEAVKGMLMKNADALGHVGISPEDAWQAYQQDPQQFNRYTDLIGLHALGPEKYFDVLDKQQRLGLEASKAAETERSHRAGEDLQIRGQNISAQNAALTREIQRAQWQDRALDRQIGRETNEIKRQDLQQKQEEARTRASQAQADRQAMALGAVDTFNTALQSLSELEASPGLSKAVGIKSAFPTLPGSDAANFEARLDTFKAQTFLPMVQSMKGMGALSDAEGKKLTDAVGALNPKMSESAFRASMGRIRRELESKLHAVKRQFDYQDPAHQEAQTPMQLSDDELVNKYLGGR
ncbi:gp11 [Sodalis phage phiSG1]|uniref:released from the phage upon host infection n=1 Tax=Sodalis phage phiSG1 TaxID=373126 RepID=UPI00006C5BFD|nr:released from the phage upon host infection [Sodalis phage phiSG1]ABN42219.1 gp11 [Sodalis phage phiSG1]BAE80483.1 conserved hypothetical protein [Sodalis phage phiSG1]